MPKKREARFWDRTVCYLRCDNVPDSQKPWEAVAVALRLAGVKNIMCVYFKKTVRVVQC